MTTAVTPAVTVDTIDHIVLTVRDVAASRAFYARIFGMTAVAFGDGRWALHFGNQKINLHEAGGAIMPRAAHPSPGSADLCFLTTTPLAAVGAHLAAEGVTLELGPVDRMGACGPLRSLYFRDPDGNLIEVANRITDR